MADYSIPTNTQINTANYIANFFLNIGWTKNAICGILGNMMRECDLNPALRESGGTGVGLVQWSEYQGNHAYLNWCNENGYTWSDIDVQLLRLKLEYEWTVAGDDAQADWCWIKNISMSYEEWAHSSQSAEYLAEVFMRNYERPGVPALEERQFYATWFYDNLSFEQPDYWRREGRPEYGNIFYNTPSHGGISTCIQGNYDDQFYSHWGLDVLRNCVGAASGAFNETYVKNTPGLGNVWKWPLDGMAYNFIEEAKEIGLSDYIRSKTDPPPLGGIIVWTDTHVAYISEVIDNDTIVVQESGYGTGRPAPVFDSNNNEIGSYKWGWREDTFTRGSDSNWHSETAGSFGTCLGFIANPAIQGYIPPTPTIAPSITNVDSNSSTQITINGLSNGSGQVTLYIKWNSNTVSQSNYDTTVVTSNSNFSITVSKPRDASTVAILPVRSSSIGAIFVQEGLKVSIPCINIYTSSRFYQSIPYVCINGQWKKAVPYVYTNGQWVEIYNDKN